MDFIGKDKEGTDVYVGSIVQYCWGITRVGPIYMLHTVTKRIEDNIIRYTLGSTYNSWKTSEVVVKSLDIPLQTEYYYNENGTACLLENKHFYKDDETYEEAKKKFNKRLLEGLLNIKL